MKRISGWFTRVAEFIAAAMLAAMFVVFLLQIATRYASKLAPQIPIEFISNYLATVEPLRWTVELLLILWLWIVFFGNAFIVRERDHVTFDIVYLAVSRRKRQILGLISAAAVVAAMLWALPETWDYIDWMKRRKTTTLRNPIADWGIPGLDQTKFSLRLVFSVYAIFMVALIVRYAWRFVEILRNGPPDSDHALGDRDPSADANASLTEPHQDDAQ